MLKYVNTGVVFQEIPDEVTLSINISNCPCHCPGCHSKYLWGNIGEPLTPMVLDSFVKEYGHDITCICFMGGDAEPENVTVISRQISKSDFDYIKIGPYIEHLGCLKDRTTNQRLYKRVTGEQFSDITSRFWR